MPKALSEEKVYGGSKAKIRANRKASSAPSLREQYTYARELRRALRGKKDPRVLVLGATPELRDIAIRLGARCLAVDWSLDTLVAMTRTMKYGGQEKDLVMKCDWTKMGNYLAAKSFACILGDASLLNTPFDGQKKILRVCNTLLKTGGRLIIRNVVYLPEKKITLKQWQKGYDVGKFYWISALWPLWHYVGNAYDTRKKIWNVEKAFQQYYAALKRGDIGMRKEDRAKLDNIYAYGRKVLHWTETKTEFEKKAQKWFHIERILGNPEMIFPEAVAIYVLKKK